MGIFCMGRNIAGGSAKDGSITTEKIADLSVTAQKIASDAIETAKIKNLSVTKDKIASGAIDGDKIASGAVTSDKLSGTSTSVSAAFGSYGTLSLGLYKIGRIVVCLPSVLNPVTCSAANGDRGAISSMIPSGYRPVSTIKMLNDTVNNIYFRVDTSGDVSWSLSYNQKYVERMPPCVWYTS